MFRIIQRLQNSLLTRWIWQYYQHEDTGMITSVPMWRKMSRRWYKINIKE